MNAFLVDFGSTFVKCLVYDTEVHKDVFFEKIPFPSPSIQEGKIFRVSESDIRGLIERVFSIGNQYECKRAYISVQMHGYLLQNADGTMQDYVSWRDSSGRMDDAQIKEIDFDKRGTSLKANLPFVRLYPQKETFNDTTFYTLGSYISYVLTGNNVTHKTDGCASGLYDVESLEGGDFVGLSLPTVLHDIEVVGTYRDMEIYTPMGDHQISYLGSGAGDDKYLVNIGTATQICCLASKEYPAGNYERRPYFNNDQRLFTVTGLTGGDKLYRGIGMQKLHEELLVAMEMLPAKKEMLFGGGGAEQAYEALQEEFRNRDIMCNIIEKNIGMEGLKWVSSQVQCYQK